ncbi:MAG TPA: DUF4349 domain-containing protein [Pyrinomonadaceae bacterium]|nr:DUF4349 domain-containing protein [Pyrinomonadaceae bacterium]
MEKARLIAVLLFSFSVTACGVKQGDTAYNTSNSNSGTLKGVSSNQMPSAQTAAGRGTGSGNGGGGGGEQAPLIQQVSLNQAENSQNQPVVIERKIIRNADLNLEANSPEESMTKITAIAESKGGFVVESQQSSSEVKSTTRDVVTMTVRVPAAKFNETLDEIRKTASRMIVENVKGEDVTEEFIDIEARLKTERALEQQFLEIMKQAKTVQEALNVQRELANVRGGIEKIEGRKRFLENQSSLSTVKIRLQTPTAFSANSSGFSSQLGQAFGSGFDTALGFILGLVTFVTAILPFLLVVVLPLALVIRYFLKRQHRQKRASEIAREEIKSE